MLQARAATAHPPWGVGNMTSTNDRVERRKHKRFQVDNSAFVILGASHDKSGRIIDISRGGLAFRYMTAVERPNGSYLAIVLPETNFYLDEVPVKTISDFELPDKLPTSSMTVRRRGVQFVNPTDNQKSQIEFFINNYTTGETESAKPNPYEFVKEQDKARDGLSEKEV